MLTIYKVQLKQQQQKKPSPVDERNPLLILMVCFLHLEQEPGLERGKENYCMNKTTKHIHPLINVTYLLTYQQNGSV